jgi:thiosulfate dehydrogenase [quinone] large subunit
MPARPGDLGSGTRLPLPGNIAIVPPATAAEQSFAEKVVHSCSSAIMLGCLTLRSGETMGLLKGAFEDYSSPLAGLPARLYTGYLFLVYGLEKWTGRFGGDELRDLLVEWSGSTRYEFYVPFLESVAIPYAPVFAIVVTAAELLLGAVLLVGFCTRLAAVGGIFLCVNFALASGAGPLTAEEPIVFIVLLVTVWATAAGRTLGLDRVLKAFLPRWAA